MCPPRKKKKKKKRFIVHFTRKAEKQFRMKVSFRISDVVTALIFWITIQMRASLPVASALRMGSSLVDTHTVAAEMSMPKNLRQCALEKEGEMKDFVTCILGISGLRQNRFKAGKRDKKRVCHPHTAAESKKGRRRQTELVRRGLEELEQGNLHRSYQGDQDDFFTEK